MSLAELDFEDNQVVFSPALQGPPGVPGPGSLASVATVYTSSSGLVQIAASTFVMADPTSGVVTFQPPLAPINDLLFAILNQTGAPNPIWITPLASSRILIANPAWNGVAGQLYQAAAVMPPIPGYYYQRWRFILALNAGAGAWVLDS